MVRDTEDNIEDKKNHRPLDEADIALSKTYLRADIRSVCTEAGMYAIRARRKTVTKKDFLDAVNKVIKGYQKFSATPKYMVYN